MEEFWQQQGRVNEQVRELITGLSRQVLQLANNTAISGEASTGNFNHSLSRLARIEFPKFWGEDVPRWTYKCEQFFEVDNIGEDMKVKIASIRLFGKALLWHQSFMKSRMIGGWPLWTEYRTVILSRFGSNPFDDPLSELMKWKQVGSIEQYQEGFDSLLSRVELAVSQAISCFLSGMS